MRGFFDVRKIRFHETTCFIECCKNEKNIQNGLKICKNRQFLFLEYIATALCIIYFFECGASTSL